MNDSASPLSLSVTHLEAQQESRNLPHLVQTPHTSRSEEVNRGTDVTNSHNTSTHKVENSYNDYSTVNNYYDYCTGHSKKSRRPESGEASESAKEQNRNSFASKAPSQRLLNCCNVRATNHLENNTADTTPRNNSAETLTNECICELLPVNCENAKLPKSIGAHIQAFMRSDFFDSRNTMALWTASQGQTWDRKPRRNVGLGDVGYFNKQGGFEILFNIYLTPTENLAHDYDPPTNFVEYIPPLGETSTYIYASPIRKDEHRSVFGDFRSVNPPKNCKEHTLYSFKSPVTKGRLQASVLTLPQGLLKTELSANAISSMESYFTHHAPRWYEYYSSKPHKSEKILEGFLKFVMSCYQAKSWAAATFIKEPSTFPEQVYARLRWPDKNTDIYSWYKHDIVSTRTGPSDEELEDNKAIRETQCVAVGILAIVPIKKHRLQRVMSASFRSVVQALSRTSLITTSIRNRTAQRQ